MSFLRSVFLGRFNKIEIVLGVVMILSIIASAIWLFGFTIPAEPSREAIERAGRYLAPLRALQVIGSLAFVGVVVSRLVRAARAP